jgi:hypothetical protein
MKEHGVLCVMTVGLTLMPKLSADNLDFHQTVGAGSKHMLSSCID